MGLFGKKKKVERIDPVEEIDEVCDCCGKKLNGYAKEINPEKADELDMEITVAGKIGKTDKPVQCELYKFRYGDKKICGYCFSQVLNDITGEIYGPQDFLMLESFKIKHINKLFSEMTKEELKNRKQKFDEKMAVLEAAKAEVEAKMEKAEAKAKMEKAEAEAKIEEEWLNSLNI